jgi:hypothetical protein
MDDDYVIQAHLAATRWVAHQALVVDGPTTCWQDVMVRPASGGERGALPGFTVEVLAREEGTDHAEIGVFPERMSVVLEGPFTGEEALAHTACCMRAAGIPLEELVEVHPEVFFADQGYGRREATFWGDALLLAKDVPPTAGGKAM